jgi:DNA replication protein DnaC
MIVRPNLKARLEEGPREQTLSPCALTQSHLPCCYGRGFVLEKKGPYVAAQVCACVRSCPMCLGRAKMIDGSGVAADCRKPSPKLVANLLTEARIPGRYVGADFHHFSNYSEHNQETVTYLHHWARSYSKDTKKGVLLSGPVGVGKTYLLASIVKELCYLGVGVHFVDFFQLINTVKGAYTDHKSDQSILEPLINVEVLVIDELGKGRHTEFELTILDQLIMGRYNQDKVIVASTNYSLRTRPPLTPATPATPASDKIFGEEKILMGQNQGGELPLTGGGFPSHSGYLEERVGRRVFSRLVETAHFIHIPGEDYRQKKS